MTENNPQKEFNRTATRVFSIPAYTNILLYIKYSLFIEVLFITCYGLSNYLAEKQFNRLALYWDWELAIPFVPWLIWGYASMLVLFLFPVFQLDAQGIHRLGRQLIMGIVIATGCFLIFPAELGYTRVLPELGYQAIYQFIFRVDYPYNLVPSLHVVLSSLILLAIMESAPPIWWSVYFVWLVIICLSVVLVHQHHLIDVVSGLLLALFCRFMIGKLPLLSSHAQTNDATAV